MSSVIYVSEKGLEDLNASLEKANADLAILREEKAKAYTATGDTWHDNPYFNKLEQDEKRKAQDVADIQALIGNAKLFTLEARNINRVQLGSIVLLSRYFKVGGEEEESVWEIVGYGETDVAQKKVAYNSPMAQAIMGLHIGDVGESTGPKGSVEYEVLGLFPDWESAPKS